jgi:hypothetical protein
MRLFVQRSLSLAILLLFPLGYIQAQTANDFRQIRWGFTPKQVKEAETLKPTAKRKEQLVYGRVPLADRTVGLEYNFNGDSLLSASYYYYVTASVTESDVTAATNEFEKLLTEKYGPGKVARVGDTKRQVVWLTPRTQINLSLGNVDRGWSLEVAYLCRVCSGDPNSSKQANTPWKPRKEIKDF